MPTPLFNLMLRFAAKWGPPADDSRLEEFLTELAALLEVMKPEKDDEAGTVVEFEEAPMSGLPPRPTPIERLKFSQRTQVNIQKPEDG